jgi:hypothetical protein
MALNANNVNFLRSDGSTTNVYTDMSIFTNTASATRRLTIESQGASGTPYLTLKARNTSQASLSLTNSTLTLATETTGVAFQIQVVDDASATQTPVRVSSKGYMHVPGVGGNKQLVLFDGATGDAPSTATNFYGFGINSGILRYQTQTTTNSHRFYTGTTLAYTITSAGGANGSDARWKTDVQNITGALAKIGQLQGKSFLLNEDPTKRQIGFIAQEVKEVVPEVVVIDTNSEEQYHFMQYDKLTALLCDKELVAEVNSLKARVATLEG